MYEFFEPLRLAPYQQRNLRRRKMQTNCWLFRSPCGCGGTVRYDKVHRPMEHIQGFISFHWMPPLGKCLHPIPPTAAKVDEFVETTQNTTKTQLLASNYGTFWSLVVYENSIHQYMNPLLSSLMRLVAHHTLLLLCLPHSHEKIVW